MEVHIDRGGQRFGPYSVEQVNSHLADGTILPTDLGWTDGMTDWVPVTQVAGVTFAAAAATAAVPPPTPAPTAGGTTCPACNAAVTAGQVICMGCGANLQGGAPATQAVAKPAGNKKLLIGVGAGVGVLALALVGYFVVYPMLTDEEAPEPESEVVENKPAPSGPGGKGGPGEGGMGPPPGGGFAGGGQGRPKGKGGGFNPMRYDQNKDGKISRTEVPQQMGAFFDRVDKNKDGFLDQTEMQSFGAGFGGFGGKGRPKGGQQSGGQQRPPQGGLPGQRQPQSNP